jgi:threonine aldolase
MTHLRIDLRSDTKTRPTAGMRRAMAEAEVGDEQAGEDPTVNRLCERIAALLGKEAALFLPSGTMCNQVAILVHCRPGDEIIAADSAHIIGSEAAGAAALAGAQITPIPTERGVFDIAQVRDAIRTMSRRNSPVSRLVSIEQTVNRGSGTIWPLATIERVAAAAREHGLVVHMDGARLLNAVVATGVPAHRYAAPCDSTWIDLSKGLGGPFGGVLAGSRDFIEAAWRWKHRLGGAMRQAGIMAAAGLYALDHHVDRLAEDHANARHFAQLIAEIPGIGLDAATVETNIIIFDVTAPGWTAPGLSEALAAAGIGIGAQSATRMRAVTHLDVDRAGVEAAAREMETILVGRRAATPTLRRVTSP